MSKNYSVEIPGCEGVPVRIEVGGIFRGVRVFHGDKEIVLNKSREFVITRNDGSTVQAQLKGNFVDTLPKLIVGGVKYEFAPPIPIHAVLWFGLPLGLVAFGGMLGGFVGFIAAYFNLTFYRSSFPAAVRYFVSGIVTVAALALYLVVASFLFNTKPPGLSGNGEMSSVQTGAQEALKPDHGWVAFDNSTDKDFKVTVPEWAGVAVSPEAFAVCQLPKGTYQFTFESDGAVVEQIEAEVIPGSFTLMNPGAKRTYVVATEFYTVPSRKRPQGKREEIKGERLLHADFGPDETFPSVIYVKSYLPFLNKFKDHERTKVYRKIPENVSALFAVEFIKSGGSAFAEVPPKFEETCWRLITEQSGEPRIQKGLVSLIEKGIHSEKCFGILEAKEVELDGARLADWVKGGEREDALRARIAAQWMVRKGSAAEVVEMYDSINAKHRQTVAFELGRSKMDPGLKRRLLEKCLKVNDYESDQAARSLVDTEGFPFDDSVAKLMDAHLETINATVSAGSENARVRVSYWNDVLKQCMTKHAATLSPEYLAERLLPAVKSGDHRAVEALINSGQAAALVPLFGEFSEAMRRSVIQVIQSRSYQSKAISEGEVQLLQKALEDEKMSQEAFRILAPQAAGNPALLTVLAAKVNAEPKEKQWESLDMQLAQNVVKDQKPDVLLGLIKAAPTRQIVKMAMLGLNNLQSSDAEKAESTNQVVQIYSQIQSEQQRVWLLEFLVSQWQRENPVLIGLLNQLIQTAPPKERFAAAKARMQTSCQGGGEIELVGDLIAKAPPEDLKELDRSYENWVSGGISKMKPENPGELQRLFTLAGFPNERIAESAVSKLPYASNKGVSVETSTGMMSLFQKSNSARVRQKLFDRLRAETPEGIQFCGVAVRDADAGIRLGAFRFLAGYYGKARDVTMAETGVQFLKSLAGVEKDAKTKTQMEQAIATTEKSPALKKVGGQ